MFSLFSNSKQSFFSITTGTKFVFGLFGTAAVFFGIGYALRPVEEIFDDLHDSESESENDLEE